jgi:hypothetical protein
MAADETKGQQHWIYVLGGVASLLKVRKWEERKSQQGKKYEVIEGGPLGSESGRLRCVQSDDVVYVFADAVRDGRLGDWEMGPEDLARHLRAEGLQQGHRSLKIFASWSGDEAESASYAERLYEVMRPEYPELTVFGYLGQVDAEGFDGHKTAGLGEGEALTTMSREEWTAKGARARDNRVQFPPE